MRKIVLISVLSFLVFSCTKDESTSQSDLEISINVKLKNKTVFPSLESKNPLAIHEYEYNDKWELIKISYYGGNYEILYHYEIFQYNSDNNPIIKLNYHSNSNAPNGFILLDSALYYYENGKLTLEEIYYPLAGYMETYEYEYDNSYLLKKSKFHNQEKDSYIVYEYSELKNIKEVHFAHDGEVIQYIAHDYDNVLKDKSEYFNSSDELFRIVKYIYDRDNNLIIEESKELMPYSSMSDFVARYEYY